MNQLMTIELLDQIVRISEETIYRLKAHDIFCSRGKNWLLKHDPNCDKELVFIEKVKESFFKDFEGSIKDLPQDNQDELLNEFMDLDDMDYWGELRAAAGFEGDLE